MIIKKITINNFRQFKGKQIIDFSCDKEKNVTVILGQNTGGKTTLIQAFKWCLYGNTDFKRKDLLNSEVARDLNFGASQDVYVEVELIHAGREYIIKRSQRFIKDYSERIKSEPIKMYLAYKEKNGEIQEVPAIDINGQIEKILPEKLSSYFFFAGEHIKEINSKGNVRDAVRGLMGLEVISNAVDRFDPKRSGSVYSKLHNSLDTRIDDKSIKLKSDLQTAQNKLENLKKRKAELERERDALKEDIRDLDSKILANAATKQKQQEKMALENDVNLALNSLANAEKRIILDFMEGHYKFFAKPLYKKALKVISTAKQEGEGIPGMYATSIDYIISRGRCICGAELSNNPTAIKHIEHEKSLLPPAHLGTMIRSFREKCEQNDNESNNYFERIRDTYSSILSIKRQIDLKKNRIAELSKQLSGNVDVGKLEQERNNKQRALERCENTLNGNSQMIGMTENEIDNLQRQMDSLDAGTAKNKKIRECLLYAQKIYDWFKEDYDKNLKEVQNGLNESINKIFKQMFHGKRIVELDDNYKITLKIDDGQGGYALDTSMGEETVKNFAFVTGLIDLARKKANRISEDNEASSFTTEPYPLVMDAAFSETDDEHIAKISEVLPKVAEQVIFIIMKKDWMFAEPVIKNYVGKSYEIIKYTQTSATVIGGNENV